MVRIMTIKKIIGILILVILLTGCIGTEKAVTTDGRIEVAYYSEITIIHDNTNAVTCYQTAGSRGGIYCIPDYQLLKTNNTDMEKN